MSVVMQLLPLINSTTSAAASIPAPAITSGDEKKFDVGPKLTQAARTGGYIDLNLFLPPAEGAITALAASDSTAELATAAKQAREYSSANSFEGHEWEELSPLIAIKRSESHPRSNRLILSEPDWRLAFQVYSDTVCAAPAYIGLRPRFAAYANQICKLIAETDFPVALAFDLAVRKEMTHFQFPVKREHSAFYPKMLHAFTLKVAKRQIAAAQLLTTGASRDAPAAPAPATPSAPATRGGASSGPPPGGDQKSVCRNWNAGRPCNQNNRPCPRLHSCSSCGQPHRQTEHTDAPPAPPQPKLNRTVVVKRRADHRDR